LATENRHVAQSGRPVPDVATTDWCKLNVPTSWSASHDGFCDHPTRNISWSTDQERHTVAGEVRRMPPDNAVTATFENSTADYLRFANQTVDIFVAENGRLPSMEFVMTHLRHTAVLFGHEITDRDVFSTVADDLQARFQRSNQVP
jgi:hypothetical protein